MYEKAGEYVMAPTRRIRLENNVLIISINVAPGRKGEEWDLTYIISIYLHIVLFYLLRVCLLQLKSKQNRLKPLLDSLWVILVVCCNFLWLRCTQLKQINTTQETQQLHSQTKGDRFGPCERQHVKLVHPSIKICRWRLFLTPSCIRLLYVKKKKKNKIRK